MLKLLSVFTFLFVFFVSVHAQVLTQGNRGKDVFEYYKGGTLAGTFSPTQISMQVNYNFVLGSPYYFYVNGDTVNGRTISGSHALSATFKITGSGSNRGKPLNITKALVRPAYRVELGYQRAIDKFDNIKEVPSPFAYAAGIVGYAEFQNVNFYDTLKDVQTNENPLIYGLHGHATFFSHSGRYALSFSGDVGGTYNQDPLIPYQARSGTIIDPNVVSQGDLLGYIGTYEKLGNYRCDFPCLFISPK